MSGGANPKSQIDVGSNQFLEQLIAGGSKLSVETISLCFIPHKLMWVVPKTGSLCFQSVQFDNREGPESVLNVLRNHGFSDDHISQLVRKRPKLLSANAEKTVVPKLEFLSSVGLSVLRALEVPQASISLWVTCHPFVLSLDTEKFKENIKKVTGMGFAPSSATFMKALDVISLTDALTWDQKKEVYKKCGWTEDDFLLAFRKNPFFMSLSCKKFSSKMDFLMKGWQPADVARNPNVLTYSLEKWIIPRCSVIRVLLLKGLIAKGEFSLGTIMTPKSTSWIGL
ncbi:uncharacterized protein Pyn_09085 [Prunus yedoensis var. nudiflora]|uniref:Uncharacterized protein n=1 Tax=Prunus yedoensis var. nudiflora TaxID=2094558 RepID=A0A314Y0P6_PRUYE|nr:uncharacterized protein Pyn_09085 [Prunus yedoensis var. nudiflora]